jgi:hypothetical protein
MTDVALNPIEQRLRKLEGLWTEFIEQPEARILRWVTDDDSVQMIQLFIDLQSEPVGEIPDLFIEFKAPFEQPANYATTMIQSLQEQYDANREAIIADGIETDWVCPKYPAQASIQDMLNVFESFHSSHQSLTEHLAIVLWPEKMPFGAPWETWVTELASHNVSESLRFVVVDRMDFPLLQALAESQPEKVVSVDPQLDMPAAYEQIVADVPGNSPGHDFRKYFVAVTNAAGSGDIAKAESAAKYAIAIATQEKWFYLVSAAQMAMGAAYFTAGNLKSTIECYRAANKAVAGADDEASKKLDVPTRMAEGSALIAAEQYKEAAEVFQNAAAVAKRYRETTSELECWRMAGWCYETDGQADLSWACGEKALAVGAKLDEATRETSMLPYVGQMLLRLAEAGTQKKRKTEIQDRMVELLGPEWTAALVTGAT